MNRVILIGRLTGEPEARVTQSGVSVTTFRIAVDRRLKAGVTDYFNVVTWRGLAETCAAYLVKGHQVCVEGELTTREYEDREGIKRYLTEIAADRVEFLQRPAKLDRAAEKEDSGFHKEIMEDGELPF